MWPFVGIFRMIGARFPAVKPHNKRAASVLRRDRFEVEDTRAYSELKRQLAARFRDDRNAYTEAKTEFVLRILSRLSGLKVTPKSESF